MVYILFIIGFLVLIKSADVLVDGASSIANKMGVSALIIGLTVVSFGTSAPELVVNLMASFSGSTDIAIGNVLGSNIANILLVLGVSAMIYPLTAHKGTVWKEIPFSFLAIMVLFFVANDALIDKSDVSVLSRIDGLVFISFFIIFFYYIFGATKKTGPSAQKSGSVACYSTTRSVTMVLLGTAGLVVGGRWIIDGAIHFATAFGVSEALIGLTIIAMGTSLPELATSAVAAYKRNVDIAVGNVIGSNIFNVFWILGVSAIVRPLPFSQELMFDLVFAVGVTLLLFLALFVGKRHAVDRWQGGGFVLLYVTYIIFLVLRG